MKKFTNTFTFGGLAVTALQKHEFFVLFKKRFILYPINFCVLV